MIKKDKFIDSEYFTKYKKANLPIYVYNMVKIEFSENKAAYLDQSENSLVPIIINDLYKPLDNFLNNEAI